MITSTFHEDSEGNVGRIEFDTETEAHLISAYDGRVWLIPRNSEPVEVTAQSSTHVWPAELRDQLRRFDDAMIKSGQLVAA